MQGYFNLLRKMNIRKDKIIDIHETVRHDEEADKIADATEWKMHLKEFPHPSFHQYCS